MKSRSKIRQQLANFLFVREFSKQKRIPKLKSFSSMKSIGILYEATSDDNYELIKQLVKDLRAEQKEVLALGFVDQKELPHMRFSKLGIDFFTRKSLSWNLRPNHPLVHNFIQTDFDVLISFHIEHVFPLKYLSAISHAKFKIARFHKRNASFCDFMVATPVETNLKEQINILMYYLKQIRND